MVVHSGEPLQSPTTHTVSPALLFAAVANSAVCCHYQTRPQEHNRGSKKGGRRREQQQQQELKSVPRTHLKPSAAPDAHLFSDLFVYLLFIVNCECHSLATSVSGESAFTVIVSVFFTEVITVDTDCLSLLLSADSPGEVVDQASYLDCLSVCLSTPDALSSPLFSHCQ